MFAFVTTMWTALVTTVGLFLPAPLPIVTIPGLQAGSSMSDSDSPNVNSMISTPSPIEVKLYDKLTFCCGTWPSRNSGFTQL